MIAPEKLYCLGNVTTIEDTKILVIENPVLKIWFS